MIDWLSNVEGKLFIVLVSSLTSIVVFILGWIIKILYERRSLTYKLKKEYEFEQKKALKIDIATHKVSLLNIVEDFNYRLWNFKENINHDWQKVTKQKWEENKKYYTRSFVYRFLVMIHYVLRIESDAISIDTTIADKDDILFLKFIKSIKDFFCESQLLKSLDYELNNNENHFFKNDLIGYSKWVIEDNKVMDYDEFTLKTQYKYIELKKVISYFSNIENHKNDRTLNVLKCFHIFIIVFLNKFGHDYQITDK